MENIVKGQLDYQMNNEEIDLVDLIKILLKHKFLIIIVTTIIFIFSCLGAVIEMKRSKNIKAVIGFNHEGISQGKNPDGSLFTNLEIIDSVVLRRTYNRFPGLSNKNISFQDLMAAFKINGIMPKNISKIAEDKLKNGEAFLYNPSEYNVFFKLTNDPELDRNILDTLLYEYMTFFSYKYEEGLRFPKLETDSLSKYDFLDSLSIVDSNILIMENRLKEFTGKSFKSSKTGYSYEDLLVLLKNLKVLDLEILKSEVKEKNITKNLEEKKLLLNRQIRMLDVRKKKLNGETLVLKEMLRDYKPSMRQMIVPTVGEMGLKISTEEEYYTNLLNGYREGSVKTTSLEVEILEIKRDLEELSSISEEEIKEIESKIIFLSNKFNSLVESINTMNEEYKNKYFSGMVRIIVPAEIHSSSKSKIIIALGLILGVIIGICAAFIYEFFLFIRYNNSKKENK